MGEYRPIRRVKRDRTEVMRWESGNDLTEQGQAGLKVRDSGDFFALREGKSNVEEYQVPFSFMTAMDEPGCLSTNRTSTDKLKKTMTDQVTHKNTDAMAIVATAERTHTRPFE